MVIIASSCSSDDQKTSEEDTVEVTGEGEAHSEQATPSSASTEAEKIAAYANDKSGITIKEIDQADTSYTARIKTLYISEENGRKLAVVYGLKLTDNGVAIIEKEGQKPVKLKQTKALPNGKAEFSNGSIILTTLDKSVQLNDNGEVIKYKEL